MTTETAETIGRAIGRAIARDVVAEDMPRVWTGLDPQDHDRIPEGTGPATVEAAARVAYCDYLAEHGEVRCQACGELKPREEIAGHEHNTGGEVQCLACHRELIRSDSDLECAGCEREED
jgi:hypothetical protein